MWAIISSGVVASAVRGPPMPQHHSKSGGLQ